MFFCVCCLTLFYQIEEALDLLLSLLETPGKDQVLLLLFEHGSADLLYVLLTRPEYSDAVQVRVLKVSFPWY